MAFDIEKCRKYEIAIMPEEALVDNDWVEPGEGEAWINPIDPALKSDNQWDGPMSEDFEEFLSDHTFYQLTDGCYAYDLDEFDADTFVAEAKKAGFDVTIVNIENGDEAPDTEFVGEDELPKCSGKKYKFTGETMMFEGHKLYRVCYPKWDNAVGGWIESEANLSQEGDCSVWEEAKVFGKARVTDNARVFHNAVVKDKVLMKDQASVSMDAVISGNAKLYGFTRIQDQVKVYGNVEINNADLRNRAEIFGNVKLYDISIRGKYKVGGDLILTKANQRDYLEED